MDEATILEVVGALSPRGGTPKREERLKEDLGVDSLRLVELVLGLEERFSFEFTQAELDPAQLVTAGDVCGIVLRHVS